MRPNWPQTSAFASNLFTDAKPTTKDRRMRNLQQKIDRIRFEQPSPLHLLRLQCGHHLRAELQHTKNIPRPSQQNNLSDRSRIATQKESDNFQVVGIPTCDKTVVSVNLRDDPYDRDYPFMGDRQFSLAEQLSTELRGA